MSQHGFFKHINWTSVGHQVMKQSHLKGLGYGLWNDMMRLSSLSDTIFAALKICHFICVKWFPLFKQEKEQWLPWFKRSRTCVQHQCWLRFSVPSHLYISNPLCFTFLSPSHDSCFFCCSLGACPGFRSEVLAQTGEWAVLPSSIAPPQPLWHT